MAKKKLFDRNTIVIIGFIVFVALGIIIFKIATNKNCPDVKFTTLNSDAIKAGDLVYFTDNTPDAETWEWDFGDSTEHETTKDPAHAFTVAGEYTVFLKVNGCGEQYQKVVVATDQLPNIDTILPIGAIKCPDQTKLRVGSVVKFIDTSDVGATSWDWRFGESGQTDATEKEASYIFKQPGKHTVTLTINGKSQMATLEVMVLPAAPPAATGPAKPAIGETEFLAMLYTIVQHKESSAHIFDKCMCNYINMPVKVNGVERQFDSYVKSLYLSGTSVKNIKVRLTSEKGCVTGVDITQEKKVEDD